MGCDDENNNCACGYDKGDCCGKNVKKAYCKECKCKDPNYKPDKNCKGTCGSPEVQGRRQLRRQQQQLWLRIRWRRLLRGFCQGRKGPNKLLQTVPVQGSQARCQRLQS